MRQVCSALIVYHDELSKLAVRRFLFSRQFPPTQQVKPPPLNAQSSATYIRFIGRLIFIAAAKSLLSLEIGTLRPLMIILQERFGLSYMTICYI